MNYPIKVNILGKEYTIEKHTYQDDHELEELGGFCRYIVPEIVIGDLRTHPSIGNSEKSEVLEAMEKETIRHEIIHAFLNESGIGQNAFVSDIPWTQNEEMIDWFALQMPKIFKVCEEIGCI